MSQQDVWNRIAKDWKHFRRRPFEEVKLFAEALRKEDKKVLSIGCGNGRQLIPFKDNPIYGCDFSSNMLCNARDFLEDRGLSPYLVLSRACWLPFHDNTFDVVIGMSLLHHIKNKEQIIMEIRRVMKSNAKGLLSVWYREEKGISYIPWGKKGKRYYYFFSKDELRRLMETYGLDVLDIYVKGDKEQNIFVKCCKG